MAETAPKHIVIHGLMGIGKTTTAQALADRLGLRHRDSDVDIQELTEMTSGEFAERHGVGALHELEAAMLVAALTSPDQVVITAAASTIESETVRVILELRATSVWLTLPVEEILERQRSGHHRRFMDEAELEILAERRTPLFKQTASITLTPNRSTDALVREIIRQL